MRAMTTIHPATPLRRDRSRGRLIVVALLTASFAWSIPRAALSQGATGKDVAVAGFQAIIQAGKTLETLAQVRSEMQRRRIQERAERLQLARKHLAEAGKDVEGSRENLEFQEAIRDWALKRFNPRPAPAAVLTQQQERFLRLRDRSRTDFLVFPEHARGAIKSGRALNFFLDACGPVAINQIAARDSIEQEQVDANQHLADLRKQGAAAEVIQAQEKRIEALQGRAALLKNLGGNEFLTQAELSKLRCEQGGSGPKLIFSLAGEPLPLNWPAQLILDPRYEPYRNLLSAARAKALADLKDKGFHDPVSLRTLMDTDDQLEDLFWLDFKAYTQDSTRITAAENAGYLEAKRFLMELRHGIRRLAEADTLADLEGGQFTGSTLPELLVFMSRHSLRFAPPTIDGEPAHQALFMFMQQYYAELCGLELGRESDYRQIEVFEAREAQTFETVQSLLRNQNLD